MGKLLHFYIKFRYGCENNCQITNGFFCNVVSDTSVWEPIWGDGIKVGLEDWDDGNLVDNDGWNSTCYTEAYWTCIGGNGKNFILDLYFIETTSDTCYTSCGDGIQFVAAEQWDDGNVYSGDGCSNTCVIEAEFIWTDDDSNTFTPTLWIK